MELWRLTRNPYGRAVWEAFDRVGLKAAKMDEWVREGPPPETGVPTGVSLEVRTVADAPAGEPYDELADGDRVVLAFAEEGDDRAREENGNHANDGGGETTTGSGPDLIGRTFLSDRPVYVPVLEREVEYDGAYVWRVFVDPDHRQSGVASALVARAVALAAEVFGRRRCVALVAVDNRPSQWLFEGLGFRARRRHTYYRAFGLERRRVTRP